jgi:hypothetical protein
MRGLWLPLLALLVANPARADWLTDAWSDGPNAKRGNPAITSNSTGVVTVVLPEAMLAQAQAAGLSPEGAVVAFLGRYAPAMCSSMINMNVPHSHLKVDLLVERPVALRDADAETQDEAAAALNQALKFPTTRSIPHIDRVFVVDQKPRSLSIDYAPDHKAHCMESPQDQNF